MRIFAPGIKTGFTLAILALILTACVSAPRTFSISESELQSRLARELSVPVRLLHIFDISLSNPVIRLDGSSERLYARLDTRISSPLAAESLNGAVDISGQLRYDAASNSIVLSESRIEDFSFNGLQPDKAHTDLLNMLANDLLQDIPLYRLKPDDLKIGHKRYAPGDFRIIGRDLRITLLPQ
jgi:hypothetical protein